MDRKRGSEKTYFEEHTGPTESLTGQKLPRRLSALNKLMDYLAQRDHSPLELKKKLQKFYPSEEIELAIEEARKRNWIPSDTELAHKAAVALSRKNKSKNYINQFLKSKGLPSISLSTDEEVKKAQKLIAEKFDLNTLVGKQRASQFLKNRGFDWGVISHAIKQKIN